MLEKQLIIVVEMIDLRTPVLKTIFAVDILFWHRGYMTRDVDTKAIFVKDFSLASHALCKFSSDTKEKNSSLNLRQERGFNNDKFSESFSCLIKSRYTFTFGWNFASDKFA